jgi:hypothetical protein
MRAEQIQSWQFAATEAADILGWSERRFANWTKRYSPFPHKNRGRGRSISYDLAELLKLAAVSSLVDAGIAPEKAFAALAPYGGPYGILLHGGGRNPGTSVYTQNDDGRWVGVDSPQKIIAVEIRAWPIFDKVFPKFKVALLKDPRGHSIGEVRKAVEEYEEFIGALRRGKRIDLQNPLIAAVDRLVAENSKSVAR